MSSTNRSDVREPDDHYQTPVWAVRAVLARLPMLDGKRILEPSAGRGAIVKALIEAGADPKKFVAVEPNEERCTILEGIDVAALPVRFEDMPSSYVGRGFDLVVMNPPFSLAEEHIRIAYSLLAPGGTVAALCRLAFFAESQCRASFRSDHPHDRLELVRRPSFTAESLEWLTESDLRAMSQPVKKPKTWPKDKPWIDRMETVAEVRARLMRTDSCAYAWGLFGDGRGGRFWTHEEAA